MADEALPAWMQGAQEGAAQQPMAPALEPPPDWMSSAQAGSAPPPLAVDPAAGQYRGWDRGLRLAGQGAVQGLTGLVGLPGNLESLGARGLDALFGTNLGSEGTFFPTTADINRTITDPLGLTNRPDLKPQNWAERLNSGLSEGLVGGAAGGAIGGALGQGTRMLPMGVAGAAGGAGAEVSKDAFPGADPWVHAAIGLGASLAAGRPAALLDQALESGENRAALGAAQQKLDAATERLQTAQRASQYGGQDAAEALTKGQRDAEAARDVALATADRDHVARLAINDQELENLRGPAVASEDVGNSIQARANQWLDDLQARKDQIYRPIEANIPAETPVDLAPLRSTLDRLTNRSDNASVNRFAQAVSPTDAPQLRQILAEAMDGPTSWNDARVIRDAVGNALGDPRIKTNMSKDALSAMYATTQQSMRNAANELPPLADGTKLGDAYQAASQEVEGLHGFAKNILGQIINSPSDAKQSIPAAGVPNKLLKLDGADLQTLGREFGPETLDGLMRAALSPQAATGAGVPGWQRLKPSVQEALVSDPNRRQAIGENLAEADALPGVLRDQQQAARDAHGARLDQLSADATATRNALSNEKFEAGQNLGVQRSARDQMAAKVTSVADAVKSAGSRGIVGLFGDAVGHNLAAGFGHQFFPNLSDYQLGAIGGLAGQFAPSLAYNTLGLLTDPRALRLVGVGGGAGAGAGARY